ncbi:hypothetical protein BDW27_106132 [Nocardiopsis sp. L17-MgMaSL7]|nr:hypothetical protein BDW27_106132 [Nocardiopsis sp. L17-MgMaSL7]
MGAESIGLLGEGINGPRERDVVVRGLAAKARTRAACLGRRRWNATDARWHTHASADRFRERGATAHTSGTESAGDGDPGGVGYATILTLSD